MAQPFRWHRTRAWRRQWVAADGSIDDIDGKKPLLAATRHTYIVKRLYFLLCFQFCFLSHSKNNKYSILEADSTGTSPAMSTHARRTHTHTVSVKPHINARPRHGRSENIFNYYLLLQCYLLWMENGQGLYSVLLGISLLLCEMHVASTCTDTRNIFVA